MVKARPKKAKQKQTGASYKQELLMDAVSQLSKELAKLRERKDDLERKLGEFRGEAVRAQNKEQQLRDEISRLVAKEGIISQKKDEADRKLKSVKEKLAEVAKIKDELQNL
ncbi:TPA: hypothetical protein HA361_02515 [Candidatus Woesearchaeota archaeon]|nr:hypothetical protein [Candidatus Woesearchaeota archaeon]HII68915.1 hypothetical protein [Candidatus Woesearchaeota archaeon]